MLESWSKSGRFYPVTKGALRFKFAGRLDAGALALKLPDDLVSALRFEMVLRVKFAGWIPGVGFSPMV